MSGNERHIYFRQGIDFNHIMFHDMGGGRRGLKEYVLTRKKNIDSMLTEYGTDEMRIQLLLTLEAMKEAHVLIGEDWEEELPS